MAEGLTQLVKASTASGNLQAVRFQQRKGRQDRCKRGAYVGTQRQRQHLVRGQYLKKIQKD